MPAMPSCGPSAGVWRSARRSAGPTAKEPWRTCPGATCGRGGRLGFARDCEEPEMADEKSAPVFQCPACGGTWFADACRRRSNGEIVEVPRRFLGACVGCGRVYSVLETG